MRDDGAVPALAEERRRLPVSTPLCWETDDDAACYLGCCFGNEPSLLMIGLFS